MRQYTPLSGWGRAMLALMTPRTVAAAIATLATISGEPVDIVAGDDNWAYKLLYGVSPEERLRQTKYPYLAFGLAAACAWIDSKKTDVAATAWHDILNHPAVKCNERYAAIQWFLWSDDSRLTTAPLEMRETVQARVRAVGLTPEMAKRVRDTPPALPRDTAIPVEMKPAHARAALQRYTENAHKQTTSRVGKLLYSVTTSRGRLLLLLDSEPADDRDREAHKIAANAIASARDGACDKAVKKIAALYADAAVRGRDTPAASITPAMLIAEDAPEFCLATRQFIVHDTGMRNPVTKTTTAASSAELKKAAAFYTGQSLAAKFMRHHAAAAVAPSAEEDRLLADTFSDISTSDLMRDSVTFKFTVRTPDTAIDPARGNVFVAALRHAYSRLLAARGVIPPIHSHVVSAHMHAHVVCTITSANRDIPGKILVAASSYHQQSTLVNSVERAAFTVFGDERRLISDFVISIIFIK